MRTTNPFFRFHAETITITDDIIKDGNNYGALNEYMKTVVALNEPNAEIECMIRTFVCICVLAPFEMFIVVAF